MANCPGDISVEFKIQHGKSGPQIYIMEFKIKKLTNHFHLEDVSFGHTGSNQVLENRFLVQSK